MKLRSLLFAAVCATFMFLLLTACGTAAVPTIPPADATQTAQLQTQMAADSLSTALAGTMTAIAPTATHTAPPPTSTATRPPSPTPSGQFGFFDVAVEQVNANEAAVTFGFQLKKDVKLDGLMIGAWPEGCPAQMFNMSFSPYIPAAIYSGVVGGSDAIRISFRKPGKCEAAGVQMFVFRQGGGNIYQQSFPASFSLEMK